MCAPWLACVVPQAAQGGVAHQQIAVHAWPLHGAAGRQVRCGARGEHRRRSRWRGRGRARGAARAATRPPLVVARPQRRKDVLQRRRHWRCQRRSGTHPVPQLGADHAAPRQPRWQRTHHATGDAEPHACMCRGWACWGRGCSCACVVTLRGVQHGHPLLVSPRPRAQTGRRTTLSSLRYADRCVGRSSVAVGVLSCLHVLATATRVSLVIPPARRARYIKTQAHVNVHTPKRLVQELQAEVERLRALLAEHANSPAPPGAPGPLCACLRQACSPRDQCRCTCVVHAS